MKNFFALLAIVTFLSISLGDDVAIAKNDNGQAASNGPHSGDGPGSAPNSGDGVSDGSGFDGEGAQDNGAPNSGDGVPDGSGK